MTRGEFAEKVDSEGGVLEAIFGYGLGPQDLDDKHGPLYDAVRALFLEVPHIRELVWNVEEHLDEE